MSNVWDTADTHLFHVDTNDVALIMLLAERLKQIISFKLVHLMSITGIKVRSHQLRFPTL